MMLDETHPYTIIVCSFLLAGLGTAVCCQKREESTPKERNNKIEIVPFAKVGIIEAISALGSREAPLFLLKHLREIQKKYNGLSCFRFYIPLIPGFSLYMVGDMQTQKAILLDQTSDKARSVTKPINKIVGVSESIFASSSHNSHWKLVRKATVPAFASKQINRMKHIATQRTENWLHDVRQHKLQWNRDTETFEYVMDPSVEILLLTFQIICVAAFEYEDVTVDDYYEFAKNFEIASTEYGMKQFLNPLRPYLKWILPEVQEAEKATQMLKKFAYKILYSYRKSPNKSADNTVIKLIDSIDTISDDQKVAEMIVYLVAGHDTTGYTIASILTLLAKHPYVFHKLKQDTKDLLPQDWSKSSRYFTSILKETFRYVPVVPFLSARYIQKDFVVTTPTATYKIPKYSTVFVPQCLMHRNANTFGSSCDTYDPDRWLASNADNNDNTTIKTATSNITPMENNKSTSMTVMPFAMGLRNCVGQSLAMSELECILPHILSQIDNITIVKEGKLDYFMTWKYVGSEISITMKKKD